VTERPPQADSLNVVILAPRDAICVRDLHERPSKNRKPSNAPFERHQGELLGVPPPRATEGAASAGGATNGGSGGRSDPAAGRGVAAAAPAPMMTPHEEEWAGGAPHAIWIEFK